MDIFRYWIGASPEAPVEQAQDVDMLHQMFRSLDRDATVEQYGNLGGMIMLKVETEAALTLDFRMPGTVIAFEHRHL